MRRALAIVLALASAVCAKAPSKELQAGTGKDTFNLVILGDGWADMSLYEAACEEMKEGLLSIEPFKRFREAFRITRVDVVSKQQGCKWRYPPKGLTPEFREARMKSETPLQIVWYPKSEKSMGPEVSPASFDAIDTAIGDVPCHVAIVVTPDTYITEAIMTRHGKRAYVVLTTNDVKTSGNFKGTIAHEMGHALFNLDEEYCYLDVPTHLEPDSPNVTIEKNPKYVKWKHLVAKDPLPTCEGKSNVLFRPTATCRMNRPVSAERGYPDDFCVVCRAAMSSKLSSGYRLIKSWDPVKEGLEVDAGAKLKFSVRVRPFGEHLKFFWQVDGKSLGLAEGKRTSDGWTVEREIDTKGKLGPGTHEVRFIVEDQSDFVVQGKIGHKAPQSRVWWVYVRDPAKKHVTLSADGGWN